MSQEPEWSKDENYSYTKKLDDSGWAWEFLRRNANYRKDYARLNSLVLNEDASPTPIGLQVLKPEKLANETVQEWKQKIFNEGIIPDISWITARTISGKIAEKWCVKCLYDPELRNPVPEFYRPFRRPVLIEKLTDLDTFLTTEPTISVCLPEAGNERLIEETETPEKYLAGDIQVVRSDYAVLAFDLAQNMDHQLQDARRTLLALGKSSEPAQSETDNSLIRNKAWKQHLMVLDALEAEATSRQIGERFGGGEQLPEDAGRECKRNALNMLKSQYSRLLIRILSTT